MRIGHVTTHWLPVAGGQQSYTSVLFETLAAGGHDQRVYQYATGATHPALRPLPRPPRALLGLREGLMYWLYQALLPLRFADLAKEDLLIVHYPALYPAVAWHRRLLVLSHGVEWDQPPLRLPHRLRRRIARRAWRRAAAVVANDSNFLREMGCALEPGSSLYREVAPGRHFIPNAVDGETFRPLPPHPALAALDAVLVPRNIWPARGIHLAIEAWARVAPREPRSTLVVAGDFWDLGYKDRLFALIREHRLEGRVLFTGPFAWADMAPVYAAARLTLVPSLRSEGTSLAALESMASGTPVVSTAVGGLADLPTLKAAPEPEALARAIEDALSRRAQLAAEQRQAVLRDFTIARWSEAWLAAVKAAAR